MFRTLTLQVKSELMDSLEICLLTWENPEILMWKFFVSFLSQLIVSLNNFLSADML